VTAPKLLTVDEAAETLRCSRRRVFELLASGKLARGPCYGRKTVVLAESVFAACEAEYHPAPAAPRRRPARKTFADAVDAVVARARAR
jgi:excisionase family DNA binding protein